MMLHKTIRSAVEQICCRWLRLCCLRVQAKVTLWVCMVPLAYACMQQSACRRLQPNDALWHCSGAVSRHIAAFVLADLTDNIAAIASEAAARFQPR